MCEKATSGRDAFTFSLRGLTTIASFTAASVIADDEINRAISERLTARAQPRPGITRAFEDFLARYYAPEHRRSA